MNYIKVSFILTAQLILVSCATKQSKSVKEQSALASKFQADIEAINQSEEVKKRLSFLMANDSSYQHKFSQAAKSLRELHILEPDNLYIKKKLALSLIKGDQFDEAVSLLENIFKEQEYKDEKVGLVLGGVYTNLNELKKAQAVYRRILAANPQNEEACLFLGKSLVTKESSTEAISFLKRCSIRMQDKPIFHYYIGKIYINLQDYEAALKSFQTSLKKDEAYSPSALGIGLIYEQQGKAKAAANTYESILKEDPQNLAILNRLVSLLFDLEDRARLIPYCERLADLDPENLNLKVRLGILYTENKNFNRAISVFKSLVQVDKENDKLLYYLAAIYQEVQQPNEAIEYYTLIGPESSLYEDSSLKVAQLLHQSALIDKAAQSKFFAFTKQRGAQSSFLETEFSILKAQVHEGNGDLALAIRELEDVMNNKEFKESYTFFLAGLYEKNRQFIPAYDLMNEILDEDPTNAYAMNFIGYSLVERNESLEQAFSLLSKASTLRPKDGYIKDSLGWYYFKVGKFEKAFEQIKLAAELTKDDPSIFKHLAIVYAKMNQYTQAQKVLEKAISLTQDAKMINQLQEVLSSIKSKRLPASFQ